MASSYKLKISVLNTEAGVELVYNSDLERFYIPNTNIWFTEQELKNKSDIFEKIAKIIKPKEFPKLKAYELVEWQKCFFWNWDDMHWEYYTFDPSRAWHRNRQALGLLVPDTTPENERKFIEDSMSELTRE